MVEGRNHVEQVDHCGRDGDDPPIDDRGRPGGPSTLRGPRDDKPIHRVPAARSRRRERRDRVHRADGTLRHREPRRPAIVAGLEEVVPRVGDEVVFRALPAGGIVHEDNRLIRHETKLGDDSACIARHLGEPACRRCRRLPIEAPAGDEEKADVAGDLRRPDDRDPVRPERPFDFLFGQPALGSHVEQRRREPVTSGEISNGFPLEARVRGRHVPVERSLRRLRGSRSARLSCRRRGHRPRQKQSCGDVAHEWGSIPRGQVACVSGMLVVPARLTSAAGAAHAAVRMTGSSRVITIVCS